MATTHKQATQIFDNKRIAPRQASEQDAWAYQHIVKWGCCVAGLDWMLVRDGYMRAGGNHLITHQILAEERGGYYE